MRLPMKKRGGYFAHTVVWHKTPANEKKGGVAKALTASISVEAPPPPLVVLPLVLLLMPLEVELLEVVPLLGTTMVYLVRCAGTDGR